MDVTQHGMQKISITLYIANKEMLIYKVQQLMYTMKTRKTAYLGHGRLSEVLKNFNEL